MENISNIFFEGLESNKIQTIKVVSVNYKQHSEGVVNIARSIQPNYKINKNTSKVLKLLLLYFTGNELFIDELKDYSGVDGSLSKGLLLIGGVGTGKTLLFKIFKAYTSRIIMKNSFQMHNALEIIDIVNISGINYLETFNFNSGNPITCYIDDIAAANENVKHYGTDYNVIQQLLSIRYNVFSRFGKLTHATSNKYPVELHEIYDERIIDRMKEMFNFIEIDGESRRK